MAKLARADAADQSEQVFHSQSKEVKNLLGGVRGLVLFTMQCRNQILGENEVCKPALWYVLVNFYRGINNCYLLTFSQQLRTTHFDLLPCVYMRTILTSVTLCGTL